LLTSRLGDTYTDFVAKFILLNSVKAFKEYDYLSRGSDERQYSTPKIGINMVSIMRSKYYEYPEYHTNLDNLLFVTHQTLQTTFDLYKILLDSLESDGKIRTKLTHEPYLNVLLEKPELGGQLHTVKPFRRQILDFIAYSDGRSFLEILEITQIGLSEGIKVLEFLLSKQAIQKELF
jgi:aminopeptidase-like protein